MDEGISWLYKVPFKDNNTSFFATTASINLSRKIAKQLWSHQQDENINKKLKWS